MPSLEKLTYTEGWLNDRGVPAGTPGAEKRTRESSKWYARWRDGKREHKVPVATDKSAVQAMMADLMRTKDRVKARLIAPRQHHNDRPLREPLDEFIPV